MSRFKKCQVVMLPTQKAENCLVLNSNARIALSYHKRYLTQDYLKNGINSTSHHLYITSDDEIKEGNWFRDLLGCIRQATKSYSQSPNDKKIIATTDSSISIIIPKGADYEKRFAFPQPSQSFIEKFVESYNKNIVIDNVLVEYECPQCKDWGYVSDCKENCNKKFLELKVNPKDNTITIKKVKDSWSREEVIKVIKNYQEECGDQCPGSIEEMQKWIDKNL